MAELPPNVTELLQVPHPTSLGPGTPATALRAKIAAAGADLPPAAQAGLWLRFDFLDESHRISQEDEGHPDRDIWHAIMHRREPDAFNSKYWWRRVGPHPVLAELAAEAATIGYRYTTPEAFVDLCEKVRDTGTPQEELAKRVQELEWRLLFAHCTRS